MKIVTILGARPQFIKAGSVSREILRQKHSGADLEEIIVHTGQHYDENMSKVFFDELDIPRPDYNLEIGGGTHGSMTGRMLEAVEKVLLDEQPNWVLIYGDTNSTLAGAIAASKLHIPVAHVEAGLRSFNMKMPEEINRILSDRVSDLLLCPTDTAVKNLEAEGIENGVKNIGDVMYDASLFYRKLAKKKSTILDTLNLNDQDYVLVTCHRAENTDNPIRLREIVQGLSDIAKKMRVILPLHPRTKKILTESRLTDLLGNVTVIEPISFLDMVQLEESSKVIVTDSGGVQKEACFFNVPCVTMRDETEWVETVDYMWNVLVGASREKINNAIFNALNNEKPKPVELYGDGNAAKKIIEQLNIN